jgi:hypothetical protein
MYLPRSSRLDVHTTLPYEGGLKEEEEEEEEEE